MVKNIIEIFNELSGTSSSNEKKKILKNNKDNNTLRVLLKFLFDKNITTGISSKKMNSDKVVEVKEDFNNIIDVVCYLSKNNSGRIYDVCVIKKFIQKYKEHEDILLDIFSKKIKLGITSKSINSAFGEEFIKEHEVQKAELYEENKDRLIGKEIAITTKLDGNRCWAYVENHSVRLVSREGKPIIGFNEIEKELSVLDDIILDGELICSEGDTSLERFQKTQTIVRKKAENKTGVNFEVYDIVNGDIYKKRRNYIEQLFKENQFENIKNVKVLYQGIHDSEIVQKLLEEAKSKNEEGIMINVCDATYQRKRTKDVLKVKVFKEIDLKVIDAIEGEGEIKNKLGAVVVKYKGFDVKVGSGFNADQREAFWKNKKEIIGKIIRIKYFEESSDRNGNISLRLPIFISVCDKKEESYF